MSSLAHRGGRVLAVVALTVGAATTGALADDVFSDVPATSAFHDDIGEFVGAECADGFPDGTFHPNDPVKRQQMARFLTRCAGRGRVTASGGIAAEENDVDVIPVSTAVTAPASGLMLVTVSGDAFSLAPEDCPCLVAGLLHAKRTPATDNILSDVQTVIPGPEPAADGSTRTAFTLVGQQVVSRGEAWTFALNARFVDTDVGSVAFRGRIMVEFVPFGLVTPA
jgi:hypothetical protein